MRKLWLYDIQLLPCSYSNPSILTGSKCDSIVLLVSNYLQDSKFVFTDFRHSSDFMNQILFGRMIPSWVPVPSMHVFRFKINTKSPYLRQSVHQMIPPTCFWLLNKCFRFWTLDDIRMFHDKIILKYSGIMNLFYNKWKTE